MDHAVTENAFVISPSEFTVFYSQAWLEIYKPLVVTVGDADLAAEAVDEGMERAFARWASVSQMSNPQGWVYRVAYRWALDRLRRRSVERRLLPRLFEAPRRDEMPAVEPRLGAALAGLAVEQRAVVVLYCAFDWPEADIAQALGVRPGTVKSRLHRGLKRLREELKV